MKFLRENFVLVLFLILLFSPLQAISGSPGPSYLNPETDNGSFQLFYYWDLRNRDSSFQVYNNSTSAIRVHVQIFTANSTVAPCEEVDFIDQFTSFDTHIYNLRNLTTNSGTSPGLTSLAGGTFGFAAVTLISDTGFDTVTNPVLQGSFRIVDDSGYEYRAHPAGIRPIGFTTDSYSFNFDSLGSTSFSDVIGIPLIWSAPTFGTPIAGPNIFAKFDPFIVDENEFLFSCAPTTFTCSATGLNKGINEAIRNTKDNTRIYNNTISKGIMRFERPTFSGGGPGLTQAEFFVGFIGLNDGGKIGSMDSFIAAP
ncbi:MAG: hypothetical protein KAJ31_00340 [Deltaproteobacteria bacterium]|nr:hypothetical protein [Deltaproteobacteria bacterium]